jgi:polyisoprenoid-binding protein YceI
MASFSGLTRRAVLLGLASGGLLGPGRARAAPRRYRLNPEASRVSFRFLLAGAPQTGTMPVERADIVIDPANLAAATVDVRLDAAGAHTGLAIATGALLGPDVLAVAQYPTIRFVSTRIHLNRDGRLSEGARIDGRLTLRGVTRPLTLDAGVYRPPGSAPDDLDRLTVKLTGRLSRAAFGASGYADLVADPVFLDITAVLIAL